MSASLSEPLPENVAQPDGRAFARGLVSVVIPAYKGDRYLAEAIESCLSQTYRDLEIIVVDDASPDRSAAIAAAFADRDPRVIVVRREHNGGVSRAFNSGFSVARGEYFTRLAQDDIFEVSAIAAMVDRLHECLEAGLVYCDSAACDEGGRVQQVGIAPMPNQALLYRNRVGLCVMWRRAAWDAVGGFDPEFDTAEDFDYWLRVASHYPIVKMCGPPQLRVRVHAEMGSIRQILRQNDRSHAVIRRHMCGRGPVSIRRQLIALAYADYITSIAYSERGLLLKSLAFFVRSFAIWPLPMPRAASAIPCGRAKLCIVTLLRLSGLRQCSNARLEMPPLAKPDAVTPR